MKSHLKTGLVAILALMVGIVLAVYIAPPGAGDVQYMQRYPQPRALPEFTLTDQQGQPFTNQQLMGKWTLTFVGYTFCPDICPTTMAELARIYPELKQLEQKNPLQILFISVDPKRDTTERLHDYIAFFNPDFVAATGPHPQLYPLIRAMGMMYSIAQSTDNPNYLVDHSSSIIVINPRGQVIGRFKPTHSPGQLAVSDGQQILDDMPILMDSE